MPQTIDRRTDRNLVAVRSYFPFGEDSLHCDYCDVIENAADLTPDWNGETGCHLSCEDRDENGAPCGVHCHESDHADTYPHGTDLAEYERNDPTGLFVAGA